MKLIDIINEQGFWGAGAEKVASEKQKCGLSGQDGGNSREERQQDREFNKSVRAEKNLAKSDLKKTLNMYYDTNNYEYEKDVKVQLDAQYQQTKSLLDDGDSNYKPSQKFAIVNKVLDYIKKFPNIPLTKRIATKFNNPNIQSATIQDIIGNAKQMGWDNFINWYLNQCN